MNKKSMIAGVAALALGILMFSPKAAYAYRGDPNTKGPNYSQERHEAMEKAFENNDYNAWKNLMQGKGRVTNVINEGNFTRFAQAHTLALEGKTDEARAVRQELGLGLGNKTGQGQQNGNGMNRWSR